MNLIDVHSDIPSPLKMTYLARSPLKVILFGEHAVLSGGRSLAVAIELYAHLEMVPSPAPEAVVSDATGCHVDLATKHGCVIPGFRTNILLEAPLGCGLGTSAAISLLLSHAEGAGLQDMLERAHAIEDIFHGRSSGVDVSACYTGGLISFRNGLVERLPLLHLARFKILVFSSGIPKDTAEAVRLGGHRKELHRQISEVSEEAYWLLQREFALPEIHRLIRRSQDLLDELGVCPDAMRRVVSRMRQIGIEAKITGAGCGGHLVTVVEKDREVPGWRQVSVDSQGFCAFGAKWT